MNLTAASGHRTRRFTTRDGLTLVADEIGPDGASTVVLLHGGGQTRHSWSGAFRALAARGYRVLNFDARGHGDSDWSRDGAYSLDHRADDLRAVIGGDPNPFALVGASLGGSTAIHAVARGLTPAALVLVDIVPECETDGVDRIVAFMRSNPDGFGSLEEAADAVAAYNPDRPRRNDPSGLMRNLRKREDGRLYWHWDPAIARDAPDDHHRVVRQSATAMANHKDLPTLLVRGLRSDVVSDAGVAAFRALIPTLQVAEVGGAGHMVAGDRNDVFNKSVIAFLEKTIPIT